MLTKIDKFRFISHKVIPLIYDESLSYYEFLCKMNKKLNEVIDNVNSLDEAFAELYLKEEAFETEITQRQVEYENNLDSKLEAFKTEYFSHLEQYFNEWIVSQSFNAYFTKSYDTTEDAIEDAPNLPDGITIYTRGKESYADGKGCIYTSTRNTVNYLSAEVYSGEEYSVYFTPIFIETPRISQVIDLDENKINALFQEFGATEVIFDEDVQIDGDISLAENTILTGKGTTITFSEGAAGLLAVYGNNKISGVNIVLPQEAHIYLIADTEFKDCNITDENEDYTFDLTDATNIKITNTTINAESETYTIANLDGTTNYKFDIYLNNDYINYSNNKYVEIRTKELSAQTPLKIDIDYNTILNLKVFQGDTNMLNALLYITKVGSVLNGHKIYAYQGINEIPDFGEIGGFSFDTSGNLNIPLSLSTPKEYKIHLETDTYVELV